MKWKWEMLLEDSNCILLTPKIQTFSSSVSVRNKTRFSVPNPSTVREKQTARVEEVSLLGKVPHACWNSAGISRLLSISDQQCGSGFTAASVPQSSADLWLTAISISPASLGRQSEGQDSGRFGLSFLIIQMIFTDKTSPIHQGRALP